VRPLDAYGALAYLRTRGTWMARASRCKAGRTAAAPRSRDGGGLGPRARLATGFVAALAFYPACGLKDAFRDEGYKP